MRRKLARLIHEMADLVNIGFGNKIFFLIVEDDCPVGKWTDGPHN